MITKKRLQEQINDLFCFARQAGMDIARLELKVALLKECVRAGKQPTKIKVKGTPGRPKKVCVKVDKPLRDKSGKFAKKK